MKEWKMYQQLYASLVTEHSDASHTQPRMISEEIVENALNYIRERSEVAVYPAKSYMVAIIYATKLEEVYGEDFYATLNDPELFLGTDEHFVTYDEDPESYDAIVERLKDIPDWINSGWAPYTINYFQLECTEEGVESVNCSNPVVILPT